MKKYKDVLELLKTTEEELERVIQNKSTFYYSYPIKKRSGKKRYIDAPIDILKQWQNIILKRIFYRFGSHPIAYGFTKNRSPRDAASLHVGKDILVAMDIKNFFNSITKKQVLITLDYLNRTKSFWVTNSLGKIATNNDLLAELLTFNGVVPQGAPTSPALTNLVMLKVDKQLLELAKSTGCVVTRYVDDIVFSKSYNGNKPEQDLPTQVITPVKAILCKYGLKLNPDKIHINRKSKRMQTMGIVVNTKMNINRETWRNFRALLHNLKMSQEPVDEKKAQILRGRIEWYKSINQTRGKQFLKEYGCLNFLSTSNTLTAILI